MRFMEDLKTDFIDSKKCFLGLSAYRQLIL